MLRRGLAVGCAAWILTGCPADPSTSDECEGEPDFWLVIRNERGGLPADLRVDVEYGGGEDSFVLAGAQSTPQVVFCEPVVASDPPGAGGEAGGAGGEGGARHDRPGGAGAAPGDSPYVLLECRLWTEGPAAVKINAAGYSTLERELTIEMEECTTVVELELERVEP